MAADQGATEPELRFPPDEEASLLATSASLRAEANALFNAADPAAAATLYKEALASCPLYLHFPRAVLQTNLAVCSLKLDDPAAAAAYATDALDGLAKLEDAESVDEGDVERIRVKALLRRARARSVLGGWSNLAAAGEDYTALAGLAPGRLAPADARAVRAQLAELPGRTKAAQEAEMAEMWGKLRGVGDSILRPFGLSTDNFQMVKDDKTGGYSMNFTQGRDPK